MSSTQEIVPVVHSNDVAHDIRSIICELEDVFVSYSIDRQEFIERKKQVCEFKFCVPLIGVFSSGKSSLINSILEQSLLSTDATPETSFPAEIVYGDTRKFIALCPKDSVSLAVTEQDVTNNAWSTLLGAEVEKRKPQRAADVQQKASNEPPPKSDYLLSIEIPSPLLKNLSNIRIRDLPGIDSSHSDHDRVISKNIKEAAAYIVVMAADAGTITHSLQMLIKELAANAMPCGLVITKTDKHEKSKIDEIISHATKQFISLTGAPPIFVATASRKKDIGSVIEGIQALDAFAGYVYEQKIINPLLGRLLEIQRNIGHDLENTQLDLDDVEQRKSDISKSIANATDIVQIEFDKFSKVISDSADEVKTMVLKVAKEKYRKDIVQLIIQGKDKEKIKIEVEDTITTAIRDGLQSATIEIVEPIYRDLCAAVSEVVSHEKEEINFQIGEQISPDIVHDMDFGKAISWKSIFLSWLGDKLMNLGFWNVGLALLGRGKPNEDPMDKARKQAREIFDSLDTKLKESLPEIIQKKTENIQNKLNNELRNKLEVKQKRITELEKYIRDNKLDEHRNTLIANQQKVSGAISSIHRLYGPESLVLAHKNGNACITIEPASNTPQTGDEPATQEINGFLPLFNKAFFLSLCIPVESGAPVFNVKLGSLFGFSIAGALNEKSQTYRNGTQHRYAPPLSPNELEIVHHATASALVRHNAKSLGELLELSRCFSSSISRQGNGTEQEDKSGEEDFGFGTLHAQYEYIFQQVTNTPSDTPYAIDKENFSSALVADASNAMTPLFFRLNELAESRVNCRTFFGTGKLFREIHSASVNFSSVLALALGAIALEIFENGLSAICDDLCRNRESVDAFSRKLSEVEKQAQLFYAAMTAQSVGADSLFNRKETLQKRKYEFEELAKRELGKSVYLIGRLRALLSEVGSTEISLRVRYVSKTQLEELNPSLFEAKDCNPLPCVSTLEASPPVEILMNTGDASSASNKSTTGMLLVGSVVTLIVATAGWWAYGGKKAAPAPETPTTATLTQTPAAPVQAPPATKVEAPGVQSESAAQPTMQKQSEQQPVQTSVLASAAPSLLDSAARCTDIKECIAVMLRSIDPRLPEVLQVAAARIAELNKAQRGDRKEARKLNEMGLAEFKNKDYEASVRLLKQANSADPADVEIVSNLGYVALQANQASEAVTALSNALLLDPRRTSTWIPIAEVYAIRGEKESAVRALLLGYEFSGNKDKTVSVYEAQSNSAERESMRPVYAEAWEKITALRRNY